MKKALTIAVLTIIAFTAQAQKKHSVIEGTTTQIDVAMPTMSLMVEIRDSTGTRITVPILVVDRLGQMNEISMKRMTEQVKGLDPIRPVLKAVQMPEVDPRLFRLTEGIREAMMKVDSVTVIPLRFVDLEEAKRTRYN